MMTAKVMQISKSSEFMRKEKAISDMILKLGITPNMLGYRYLILAVELIPEKAYLPVTKELYPEIARVCGYDVSASDTVERAIRHAINVSWNRDSDKFKDLGFEKRRPTNSEIIFLLREKYRFLEL